MSSRSQTRRMQLPVLNYHAIGAAHAPDFDEWTIERADFARQLDMLAEKGLTGVSMAHALQHPSSSQVALTFDDGYRDFVTEAVPELAARGFSATVFVATGHIGDTARWLETEGAGDRPMASWDELRAADRAGFEIGSHSHSHAQLDLLTPTALRAELETSRDMIERELGHPIRGFCYPHGFHGTTVRQAVIDAGYDYACGVKHKLGTVDQDPFSIARIVVRRGDSDRQIARWLSGRDLRLGGPIIEKALAGGFRLYRRVRHRS